jgi:hypothetical protein
MNLKNVVKAGSICLIAFSAVLIVVVRTGCRSFGGVGPNFAIEIQNNYILWVSGADSAGISDSTNRIVIHPHVKRLNTQASLVFGFVVPEGNGNNKIDSSDASVGRFILDTTDGSVSEGLTKEEWLKKLQAHGIQEEPELIHPSLFFNWKRTR